MASVNRSVQSLSVCPLSAQTPLAMRVPSFSWAGNGQVSERSADFVAHRVWVALDFEQGVDIPRLRLAQQELASLRTGEAWHPRYRAT